jgi:hypothetical protein
VGRYTCGEGEQVKSSALQAVLLRTAQRRTSARKVMAGERATQSNDGKYDHDPSACRPASLYAVSKLGKVVVRVHIQPLLARWKGLSAHLF